MRYLGYAIASFLVASRPLPCEAVTIYDAVAHFSTVSNPNGVWGYHYSNDTLRDGNYSLFSEVDPLGPGPAAGSVVWHADQGALNAQRPYAGINTTSSDVGTWAIGELAIHPGQSGGGTGAGLAILSWESPLTGTADIDFSIALGLSGNVLWYFDRGDSSDSLASGSLVGSSGTDVISLTDVAVNSGDQLNFVVDSNGSVGNDLVRISTVTIALTAVPAPSSFAALISIVAATALMRCCNLAGFYPDKHD